jgi:uncharacterized tellurite resistance protein B-like protein
MKMAFLDKLTKTIGETADKVSEAAKNLDTDQLQQDAKKAALDTLNKAKDTSVAVTNAVTNTAKQIDPKDIPGSLSKMAGNAGKAIAKHNEERKETQATAKKILTNQKINEPEMTVHDALVVIYLLMSIDRNYSQEEETVFLAAGNEIDQNFNTNKNALIAECQRIVEETETGDSKQSIQEAVSNLIAHSAKEENRTISGRMMVWNLIAAAYADGYCAEEEYQLIVFVANELHVKEDILMDMETAMKTIIAVNHEEQWLNSSDRPYRIIKLQIEELNKRKENIMLGINFLLKD